jgi:hypothetical protein
MPPFLSFTAANRSGTAGAGDVLPVGGPVTLHVKTNAPTTFTIRILKGNQPIHVARGPELTLVVAEDPAIYRVEVDADRAGQPIWMLSNPIYVGGGQSDALSEPSALTDTKMLFDGKTSAGWGVERDPLSAATLHVVSGPIGSELELQYTLSSAGAPESNAALVARVSEGLAGSRGLALAARADRPMRLSVQFRTFGGSDTPSERWRRSIFIDPSGNVQFLHFADLAPVGAAHGPIPPLAEFRDILFVVDRTNTKPGASGTIWIDRVALQR